MDRRMSTEELELGKDALTPLSDRSLPVEIIPKLFIGNLRASKNREILEKLGITHILTVAGDIEPEFPKKFKYKIIEVDDTSDDDLSKHFDKCFRFIDKGLKDGGILVHCQVGISRSPSIAIAYLMYHEHMSYDQAYRWVKEKDPLVAPNAAFAAQLQELEKKLEEANRSDGDSDSDSDAKKPSRRK